MRALTISKRAAALAFSRCTFYCNEDAFDMMDAFRETAGPDADLQTLARGVNVVGLESQSSDVVKLHAELFKKHGITTIRNFDALNDVENLIYSGRCIVEAGLKHQVTVTMMELPPGCSGAHDADFYEATLRKILDAEIPFDAVCFKDASGTAVPSKVHETIRRARKMLPAGAFIHFHTHETAGIGVSANRAALDAGADAIDLSMAPVSGGTCQPDILVMWHALRGTEYDLGVDVEKVREAEEVFKECMRDYFLPPEATAVEPLIPWSPMPGGALTANTQMLRDNGLMDRYPETIKAMSDVVRRGGFGTSVTPVSQFYFQQAFNNVMFGPWEKIAESYGKMVLGYFGRTPVPPDPELVKKASEQLELEPTSEPPLARNDADPTKGVAAAKKELEAEGLATTDENIFIAAACKEKGIQFLKGEAKVAVRKNEPAAEPKAAATATTTGPANYMVTVDGRDYRLHVDKDRVSVDGKGFQVAIKEDAGGGAAAAPTATPSQGDTEVTAQMPGLILRLDVAVGDRVAAGDGRSWSWKAMKMEMQVAAPTDGTVTELPIAVGDRVGQGEVLARLA